MNIDNDILNALSGVLSEASKDLCHLAVLFPVVRFYNYWKREYLEELILLNCGVGEDS